MKKHILWIIELLVWALLIFSVLFVSIYTYNSKVRKEYTYHAFFHDVDGLIKGSPVKFQGYQVGHISNIAFVNDEVFLTFIITDSAFKMPSEMIATVEFTGMGGSKSLDLTAIGTNEDGKNIITTIEPRRLQDFYVYGDQIAQNIVVMTSDFMKMFDEKRLYEIKALIKNPVFLKQTDKTMDDINKSFDDINKRKRNLWKK